MNAKQAKELTQANEYKIIEQQELVFNYDVSKTLLDIECSAKIGYKEITIYRNEKLEKYLKNLGYKLKHSNVTNYIIVAWG